MSTLGLSPGCLPATILCAGIQSGVAADFVSGGLKTKPLEVSLQHRPGPPHTMPTEAAVLAGGYPLEALRPHVVRVAPLHDAGITARPKTARRDLYSVGEGTVSCMPRSFATVISAGLSFPNQRTRSAYTVCSDLSRGVAIGALRIWYNVRNPEVFQSGCNCGVRSGLFA